MPEWDNDNNSRGGGRPGFGDGRDNNNNDWDRNRPGPGRPGFPGHDNDWDRGGRGGNDWDRDRRPGYGGGRLPIIRRPPVVYRSRPYKRPPIFNFPSFRPRAFNHRPRTNPAWWYPYWNQWVAPIINPIYSWFQPYPQPNYPTVPTYPYSPYPTMPPQYPPGGYNPYPQNLPSVIYP